MIVVHFLFIFPDIYYFGRVVNVMFSELDYSLEIDY